MYLLDLLHSSECGIVFLLIVVHDYINRTFYSNNFSLEPELYSCYQQPDHRVVDVPFQSPPLMIDYQSASVNDNHNPIFQQPLSPRMKLSDWRCQQVCLFGFCDN